MCGITGWIDWEEDLTPQGTNNIHPLDTDLEGVYYAHHWFRGSINVHQTIKHPTPLWC